MPGSLNDILPEPISEANEKVLKDLLKRKLTTVAGIAVALLHGMEERFGPEAREVVQELAASQSYPSRTDTGEPAQDLREFCDTLDTMTPGSHTWERIIDESGRIGYHFTRCVFAEIFRELGEPELGFVLCAGDEPWVTSYNPEIAFSRTKTLMEGADVCDHVFSVKK